MRLANVFPVTRVIIILLLYWNIFCFLEVIIILPTLPMAPVGGLSPMYTPAYDLSVATGAAFIVLAGVSVTNAPVMQMYLNQRAASTRHSQAANSAR